MASRSSSGRLVGDTMPTLTMRWFAGSSAGGSLRSTSTGGTHGIGNTTSGRTPVSSSVSVAAYSEWTSTRWAEPTTSASRWMPDCTAMSGGTTMASITACRYRPG